MTMPEQKIIDEEHLRLLRIAYFIAAAWNLFWIFFPMIYVGMGLFLAFMPQHPGDPSARFVGSIFALIGCCIVLVMATLTILKLLTARALGQRRSRVLCLITAGISCIAIPYGTALGVATILVLMRPSVVELFAPQRIKSGDDE